MGECSACGCKSDPIMSVKIIQWWDNKESWREYCKYHGERRIRIEEGNKLLKENR